MIYLCVMILGFLSDIETIGPETPELIEACDLIAYVEVISVDPVIEEHTLEPLPPGSYRTFPGQEAQVRVLRLIKGETGTGPDTIIIFKKENGFYLSKGDRRVVYLKQEQGFYEALGNLGGEPRLASAIWELHCKEEKGYGVVAGALGEASGLVAVALGGRHSVPLIPESEEWVQSVVKKVPIDEQGVAEIHLEPGNYTILLQKGKEVYHPNRLVNGFYPYVILDQESRWKIVYIKTGDKL